MKFIGISNPLVPQEFLLTVVLVYHTVGLYNLDEDWGIETVILVVLALTTTSQVPRYQFDRDPRYCSAGIPMVGVLRRKVGMHLCHATRWVHGMPLWQALLEGSPQIRPENQLARSFNTFRVHATWIALFLLEFESDWYLCYRVDPFCTLNILQLSLAVVFILKGRAHDFISWWGIKCSSFVAVNAGTSKRSKCNSVGLPCESVDQSNSLLERTGCGVM